MSEKSIPAWPKLQVSNTETSGSPHLVWAPVKGVSQYEIYRADSKDGAFTRMWVTENTSYTNTSAVPGKTYYFKVLPVKKGAKYSEVARITCGCARPALTVKADPVSGCPVLKWNAVPGAGTYEILRSDTLRGEYTVMRITSYTTYQNTAAVPGYTYFYRVRAVCKENRSVGSAMSKIGYVTCDCARPEALAQSDPATGKPCISWERVSDADRYTVTRAGTKNGKYTELKTVSANRVLDEKALPGMRYYYRVIAKSDRSAFSDSTPSPTVTAACALEQPKVAEKTDDAGQCVLSWQPVEGAVRYEITRAARPNGTFIRIAVKTETVYSVPPLGPDTVYYRVRAIGEKTGLVSELSEPAAITGE